MRCGSGLRHGCIAATLRPSPQAVSARWGDDPRFGHHPRVGHPPGRTCPPHPADPLSPFVPVPDDSKSGDADPRGTSLALPYRLARDQPDRPFHARTGSVRAMPPPPWPLRRPARRRRRMVGRGDSGLVRRSRTPAPAATRVRGARGSSHDAQTRLSCNRPPQPRSDLQWSALAKPRRALPALPHDPRRARASSAPLVECLSPSRARRLVFRSIRLADIGCPISRSRRHPTNDVVRTCGTSGTGSSACARHGSASPIPPSRARLRGEDADEPSMQCSGGHDDRSLSNPQDDRGGATTAGR